MGEIVYVDRFGNLISNITRSHVEESQSILKRLNPLIRVAGHMINGLVNSYSEGYPQVPHALINSDGQVEVFVKEGNAAITINVGRGQRVDLL